MEAPWSEDILGGCFRALTLPLEPDDEGLRVATLVAYEPDDGLGSPDEPQQDAPQRAVLYVHGFSDYFFHRELARAVHARGWAFFALDLHKYGRSLLPGQTPGFAASLEEYDDDLEVAIAALRERLAARSGARAVDLVLMAHSTGGLTCALWAARHPGRVSALVLNSPWLDTQGSALLRTAAQGILDTVSRRRPKTRLRLPELGFYFRSISDTRDGEWSIDPAWRPEAGFPIRAGWLAAVLAGHAALARGVSIDAPVLVLCSAASTISATWSSRMLETDSVLDVTPMVRRAAELGPHVTIRRFEGALHDVFLSRHDVRYEAVDAVTRWLEVVADSSPCSGRRAGEGLAQA
ncbi:alpha/beta hydrolase [Arthrobacter sp. NamB2]|uniref:alpha/beta hydrolase n=1 Tax=Arthrobacter sp. NamB2 TaxID=2576035 RepID=UPI0010C9A477|nr:alpha/beta hydrolase [Arthrobacter sp. NamB2]TKV26858.1 alpha/beta hydrolase [Arthrobacter sp. NamB2]